MVRELLDAGHTVTGLAALRRVRRGADGRGRRRAPGFSSTTSTASRRGAEAADGVCHLAFIHDFTDFARQLRHRPARDRGDRRGACGHRQALRGDLEHPGLDQGRVATEEDRVDPESFSAIRQPSEIAAVALAERGVRSSVVRLPRSVHGTGDKGFVAGLIAVARQKGVSAYVGDGTNRWPAVHRLDAARLYLWALESAPAGAQYHAVGDEGWRSGRSRRSSPPVSTSRREA
ncbi:hypothetical protein ACRAWF_02795 [Streptomyces sp. L7]